MESNRLYKGIVYVATGDKYYNEALVSATSVKNSNLDLPITIFTDKVRNNPVFDKEEIIANPLFSMGDKLNIRFSPYDRTLFLDSDTYVTSDINEIFDLLDRFDFAGAHEIARGYWYRDQIKVTEAFAEINSGVLLFKKNERVDRLLNYWVESYKNSLVWLAQISTDSWVVKNDQPSLLDALWHCNDIQLGILATEYNVVLVWGAFVFNTAKIIHGRGNLQRIATDINRAHRLERVYLQQFGVWPRMEHVPLSYVFSLIIRWPAALAMVFYRRIFKK